jgi:hypothetical protein
VVRERFGGKLSYASLPFEGVDNAFVNVARYNLPHRSDRREDLILVIPKYVQLQTG